MYRNANHASRDSSSFVQSARGNFHEPIRRRCNSRVPTCSFLNRVQPTMARQDCMLLSDEKFILPRWNLLYILYIVRNVGYIVVILFSRYLRLIRSNVRFAVVTRGIKNCTEQRTLWVLYFMSHVFVFNLLNNVLYNSHLMFVLDGKIND